MKQDNEEMKRRINELEVENQKLKDEQIKKNDIIENLQKEILENKENKIADDEEEIFTEYEDDFNEYESDDDDSDDDNNDNDDDFQNDGYKYGNSEKS